MTTDDFIQSLMKNENLFANRYQRDLFGVEDYRRMFSCGIDKSIEKIDSAIDEIINQKQITERLSIIAGNADDVFIEQDAGGADSDTVYDLASATKLFTMICIVILKECGLIHDDDPLKKFCPLFQEQAVSSLTIQQLYSFYANLQTPKRLDEVGISAEEAEARLFAVQVKDRTEAFRLRPYSDFGSLILKYVIEATGSECFYTFLKENVLDPLGMKRTTPYPTDKNFASSNDEYRIIKGDYQRIDTPFGLPNDKKAARLKKDAYDLSGHAGLFSTANDLKKLAQGLLRGEIISSHSLCEMGICRTEGNVNGQYGQFFGQMTYVKNPIAENSEVPHCLSGPTITSAGYTGTHITIDPLNQFFYVVLGNRCHKRVTSIIPEEGKNISDYLNREDNTVTWINGERIHSSKYYVYQKDILIESLVVNGLLHQMNMI